MGYARATVRLRRALTKVAATGSAPVAIVRRVFIAIPIAGLTIRQSQARAVLRKSRSELKIAAWKFHNRPLDFINRLSLASLGAQ